MGYASEGVDHLEGRDLTIVVIVVHPVGFGIQTAVLEVEFGARFGAVGGIVRECEGWFVRCAPAQRILFPIHLLCSGMACFYAICSMDGCSSSSFSALVRL